jgi:hypothetical protein
LKEEISTRIDVSSPSLTKDSRMARVIEIVSLLSKSLTPLSNREQEFISKFMLGHDTDSDCIQLKTEMTEKFLS